MLRVLQMFPLFYLPVVLFRSLLPSPAYPPSLYPSLPLFPFPCFFMYVFVRFFLALNGAPRASVIVVAFGACNSSGSYMARTDYSGIVETCCSMPSQPTSVSCVVRALQPRVSTERSVNEQSVLRGCLSPLVLCVHRASDLRPRHI